MKPHKWAKEIKAWADGAEIECRFADPEEEDKWQVIHDPCWYDEEFEFRIKPQPKEPQYLYVYHTTKGIELGYAPHEGMNMYNTKIVGKIKLEVDDD